MNDPAVPRLVEPVTPVDHMTGAPDARVTIVEYGDFECPNCRQAAPAIKILLRRFRGRICFVYRHFPLEQVHPNAVLAAEAAEAAGAQGKFWPMHDLLFENQRHLQRAQLDAYAEKLQLEMSRYNVDIDGRTYLRRVREHQESGSLSGVRATPAFFVNGDIADASFGVQALAARVAALL